MPIFNGKVVDSGEGYRVPSHPQGLRDGNIREALLVQALQKRSCACFSDVELVDNRAGKLESHMRTSGHAAMWYAGANRTSKHARQLCFVDGATDGAAGAGSAACACTGARGGLVDGATGVTGAGSAACACAGARGGLVAGVTFVRRE